MPERYREYSVLFEDQAHRGHDIFNQNSTLAEQSSPYVLRMRQ